MKLNEFDEKKKLEDMTNDELYAIMSETVNRMSRTMNTIDKKIKKNERADNKRNQ